MYGSHSQVPNKSKSGPCCQDEVLILDLILRPKVKASYEAGRCGSTKLLQKLLGLSGLIKSDILSVHNSNLVIGAKMT
jgi:hypothetical protein